MKDIIIDERYRVDYKIGAGGFGLVYAGTDNKSHTEVAIKLMHVREDSQILKAEARIYKVLAGGVGIPHVLWFGQECDYYALVHELLGPSLEDLFNYCQRRLSIKTVFLIADQAISRIQYIHSKGYLHRDIKPDNFLMGIGTTGNTLYAIDFGLAKEYCNAERFQTMLGRPFGGTLQFASLNNDNGKGVVGLRIAVPCARLLAVGGAEAPTEEELDERIRQKKRSLPVAELCEGLPEEFATYISYTRSLKFTDRPDYAYLRRLFRRAFLARGFKFDAVFDWTERRFSEIYGDAETTVSAN